MVVVESIGVSRPWLLLFWIADRGVSALESMAFTLTGRYLLPDPDLGDCWVDRLVDWLEVKAGAVGD